jgi:hypothetical protein
MSDNNSPPELEEALVAIEAASSQRHEAFTGIEDACESIDRSRETVSRLQGAIEELQVVVSEAEGMVDNLSGKTGYGVEDAWRQTEGPFDLLKDDIAKNLEIAQEVLKAHVEADGDEAVQGEFVTDSGERFKVSFERVDSDDEDTDTESDDDTDTDSEDDMEGLGELFG